MAVYGEDIFTDADSTLLSAHTPDVGTSWDVESSGLQIQANRATGAGFAGGSAAISDGVPVDDYQVSATIYNDGMFNFDEVHIIGRGAGGFPGDAYSARYSANDNEWQLCRLTSGGGVTVLDSVSTGFGSGDSQNVTLVMNGDALAVYLDSTLTLSATDSGLSSGGYAGIRILTQDDFSGSVDGFQIADIGGALAGTHTLTGAGSVTIAGPAAISLSLDVVPVWVTPGKMDPPNYFHMGLLAWGNDHGEMRPEPVIFVEQLFQIPPGMTTLYWWLEPGVTGTAIERASL